MKRTALYSLIALLLLSSGLWAQSEGTFDGKLVSSPQGKQTGLEIYLKGPDGNVRPIMLTHAYVEYNDVSAVAEQRPLASEALVPGADVRVTALFDAQTEEWTASSVEVILHHAAKSEDDYREDGEGIEPVNVSSTPSIDTRTI
jgi:hypothetical protein